MERAKKSGPGAGSNPGCLRWAGSTILFLQSTDESRNTLINTVYNIQYGAFVTWNFSYVDKFLCDSKPKTQESTIPEKLGDL